MVGLRQVSKQKSWILIVRLVERGLFKHSKYKYFFYFYLAIYAIKVFGKSNVKDKYYAAKMQ